MITENLEIFMCKEKNKRICEKGALRPNWKLDKLLLENERLLLAINDSSLNRNFFFIYDFEKQNLNWFVSKLKDYQHLKLFSKAHDGKFQENYFLFNYLEKGFKIFDLTFNKYLVVKPENVVKDEPIKLFLGKTEIFELKVKIWDGKSVIDEKEDYPDKIQSTDSEVIQYKLPWLMENEKIKDQNQ